MVALTNRICPIGFGNPSVVQNNQEIEVRTSWESTHGISQGAYNDRFAINLYFYNDNTSVFSFCTHR